MLLILKDFKDILIENERLLVGMDIIGVYGISWGEDEGVSNAVLAEEETTLFSKAKNDISCPVQDC